MDTDNHSGGRLRVDECWSDNRRRRRRRKRFEIELKPGETTIVSWLQLLKHSSPKQFHQENESKSKCSNIVFKKEKNEQNYRSPAREHCRPKKQTSASEATKIKKVGHARVRSIALTSNNHSLGNGTIELPDLNMPYTVQAASTLPTRTKDECCSSLNGSMLEITILELETMAADSRLLHDDIEDSVGTKSKLPRELKKKLETVAKLAHSSHGRISDELIMHLMSILGHWLKPRTLKRWLRDMVPSEISACGGDAIRFSQIKNEVIEMIKLRNHPSNSKGGSDHKTMELHASAKAKYSMDHELEDKICDFYDIYVQGMDEIKSSEIRKFYVQLAALWPNGTMDNHGVRNAICSSKERRRTALQEKGHEKGERKMLIIAGLDEDLHGKSKLGAAVVNDTNAPVLAIPDTAVPGTPELDQNLRAPAKRFSPPSVST